MPDLTKATTIGLPTFRSVGDNPSRPMTRFSGQVTGTGVIRRNLRSLQNTQTLHFPLERLKYFMRFSIYRHHRSSESQGADQIHMGDIIMPLSQTLVDAQSVAFDTMPLWTLEVINRGFSAVSQLGSAPSDEERARRQAQAQQQLQSIQDPNERSAFQQFIDNLSAQNSNLARGSLHQLGWAPNQFLTIVLEGPKYKTFELHWSLTPTSPAEAEMLRAIIRGFQNAQAPGMSSTGLLWSFPKIFHIGIYPNSSFMMKYKKAVLTDFAVNLAPYGQPAFRREDPETNDGQGNPLGTPTTIQLSCKFMELEYWLENQYNDDNNPHDTQVPAVRKQPSQGIEF